VTLPDPYYARRRRKARTITFVGLFLLGLVAAVIVLTGVPAMFTTPWGHRTPELEYLASLPYPDPHPDEAQLLIFTPRDSVTDVSTHWLRLATTPDGAADPAAPAGIYVRFATVIEGRSRGWPPADHIYLHLAAAGPDRLPTMRALEHTLSFRAGRTIELTTGRDLMETASRFDLPPLRDHMLFMIHPDAILDLLAEPAPTIAIAGHQSTLTDTHLAPLRAIAATLRPGYTLPPLDDAAP
jgi:hypothetical protein